MSDKRCIHCANNKVAHCDREHCDRVRIGEPYTTDQCRPCYLYFHEIEYNLAHGGDGKITSAPPAIIDAPPTLTPPRSLLLGDMIELALSHAGVTKERVSEWLGVPCGCAERQRRLNELHQWAKEAISAPAQKARGWLGTIIGFVSHPSPPCPEDPAHPGAEE